MTRRGDTSRVALALALIVTTSALLALRPSQLEHWDEIQIELGMRRFDLVWHEPHPPGYVLFVLSGRALGFLTKVAHPGRLLSLLASLVWVTLVARRLPKATHALARWGFVLAAPMVLVLSPTFLAHATGGRTYLVESTLWLSILLLVSTAPPESRFAPLGLGPLVGLGGGFRPTVLAWGLAATAYFLYTRRARITRRQSLELVIALVGSVGVWVLALGILCGGLARYASASRPLLRDNVWAKSVFAKGPGVLFERFPAMVGLLWDAMGPLLPIAAALIVFRVIKRRESTLSPFDPLLYGSALSFLLYLSLIFDSDGYALSYAMPLVTWTILAGATWCVERRPLVVASSFATIVAVWCVLPLGLASKKSVPATRARLRARADARFAALRTLDASSTLVTTGQEHPWGFSFRMIQYEAPELALLQLAHDPYIVGLSSDRPYLAAIDRAPFGVGPDGVDLATLPFFSPTRPLRRVVLAVPKEAPIRMSPSCRAIARVLRTSEGEELPVVELGADLHVRVRAGRLECERGS